MPGLKAYDSFTHGVCVAHWKHLSVTGAVERIMQNKMPVAAPQKAHRAPPQDRAHHESNRPWPQTTSWH
eukprot:15134425-Alexandrium_andersonii.AAC.1